MLYSKPFIKLNEQKSIQTYNLYILRTFTAVSSASTTTSAAPKRRPKYFPKQFECFYFLSRANLTFPKCLLFFDDNVAGNCIKTRFVFFCQCNCFIAHVAFFEQNVIIGKISVSFLSSYL